MASQKGESLSQDLAVGLHLEGLVLWDVIETENSVKKKDRQIQSLRRDYKNLSMDEEELILNYFEKLSHVVIELRSLREKISLRNLFSHEPWGKTNKKPPQMKIAAEAEDAVEEEAVAEEAEEVPPKSEIVMMNHSLETTRR
ncbi:unnamed protein product [Spirodela intermedia]|uniref:Uncharacterized protein n=1 Tax=Spirodela intermedia TaxID=51605 RepID=A0A7I8LC87_SPIIN|nr:unnamed protein product [Spirodela intermedia]